VLVVDNHEFVRRGLAALIDAEEDMVSCGAVACDENAVDAVMRLRPDVVIIDVSLARGTGLELIQRIRRCGPSCRIVALAMIDRPELVEQIFDAGAAAFVRKTDLAARVLETIRRSATGRRQETVGGAGTEGARHSPMHSGRCLEPLEREIVEMIGCGIPTRAIAIRLGMSVSLVDAYRRRIRSKLNFPTGTQLVEFCVRWAERNQASVPSVPSGSA
jgi:DNA-binding NarL/FixJ family response regulator